MATGLITLLSLFVLDIKKFYSLKGSDSFTVRSVITKCSRHCYAIIETTANDFYQVVADPGAGLAQIDVDLFLEGLKEGKHYQVSYIGYTGSGPFGRYFSPSYKIITHLQEVDINK